MAEIIFSYQTILTTIRWHKNERFKDVLAKFISKKNINLSSHIFLYNGSKITNYKLTFDEIANSFDKINRKIMVLVLPIEIESGIGFDENNVNSKKFINLKRERDSTNSPAIEELSLIIFNLKKEVKELKENNYNIIEALKEEIKSIKEELKMYKKNNEKSNNKIKNELSDIKNKNTINTVNIQKSLMNFLQYNMIFPKGMIVAWFGNINKIPYNWAICNGENGTPDLRNRFIMGAGDMVLFNKIGGNSYIQLQKSNLPPIGKGCFSSYSHFGEWHHKTNGFIKYKSHYNARVKQGHQDDWGSNWIIDLDEGMNSSPINIINPYYALFYIMKL